MSVIRKVQVRRGSAAAWSSANPVLSSGEFGYDETNDKVKIGDGATAWNSLAFAHYKPSEVDASVPIINLDDWGVHPGNSAATNQTAIANLIAKIKNSSEINRFHLRLNRAGTFMLQRGTGDYATRKACILLPSNCKFELGGETRLKLASGNSSYLIRNDDPINGNVNIEVCGGIWDGNKTGGQPSDYDTAPNQGWYETCLMFENVNWLHLHDLVFTDPAIWASFYTKIQHGRFSDIHFDQCDRDGIHFTGQNSDIHIERITGTCHDNCIALSSWQGTYFAGRMQLANGDPIRGSIERVKIRDCTFDDCDGPIAIFGTDQEHCWDVSIDGVYGSTGEESAGAIQVVSYAQIGNGMDIKRLSIENVNIQTRPGEAAINVLGQSVKDLRIRNLTVNNGSGIVVAGDAIESLSIDGVYNPTQYQTIQLGLTGVPFYAKSVQIDNVQVSQGASTANVFNFQANASWDEMQIGKLSYRGSSTARLIQYYGTTRRKINIDHASFSGGPGLFSGPMDVYVDNLQTATQSYIAEGNARVHAKLHRCTTTSTPTNRCGSGGIFTTDEQRLHFVVTFSDLAAIAATAGSLFSTRLPRGAILTGASFKHTTAFAGPSIATVNLQVRKTAGGTALLGSPVTVSAATNNTAPAEQAFSQAFDINADPAFDILATSTGANLQACTAGVCYITVTYRIIGTSH